METLTGLFSAFGLSASAGLNAYIPLLAIALVARFTDWIELSPPWDMLSNPWIIGLIAVLALIEFFADKAPVINHINDIIQTFVRPIAGAIAFAASAKVITDVHPLLSLAMGLLVAGSVHVAKAGALRPAVTATTGGAANAPVSLAEDIFAAFLSMLALLIPIIIGIIMVIAVATIIWLLWRRANRLQQAP
jgi:uncharacterized membrane protein